MTADPTATASGTATANRTATDGATMADGAATAHGAMTVAESAALSGGASPLPLSAELERGTGGEDAEDAEASEGVRRGRWVEGSGRWRRVAPVVLLVGLGLALGLLRSEAPREQEITVRIEGPRETVTGVEVQVIDAGGEQAAGARWSFAPGKAPGSVRSQAKVKPGRWRVRVQIESAEPTHVERSVQLEGEPVSVVVRTGT